MAPSEADGADGLTESGSSEDKKLNENLWEKNYNSKYLGLLVVTCAILKREFKTSFGDFLKNFIATLHSFLDSALNNDHILQDPC